MSQAEVLTLAIALVVLGVVAWWIVRWLLRLVAGKEHPGQIRTSGKVGLSLGEGSQEALLVIGRGGKVTAASASARQALQLAENETPDLEQLAKSLRPSEQFLALCATEGHARLFLAGRLVEGSSFRLMLGTDQVMIVELGFQEVSSDFQSKQKNLTSETLQIYSELSRAMGESLDFATTLQTIQLSIEKLIPTNFFEITIWDPKTEFLVPYRFIGQIGVEQKLEPSKQQYRLNEGYSGFIAANRQSLLVANVDTRTDIKLAIDRDTFPIRSYIGVPLLVENELIGTLELGSLETEAFHQDDLSLLSLVAGQAAVALRNSVRYQEEQKRVAELVGLAQLTQGFSSVRDPKSLFSRLVDSIVPLIPVEIMGFLLYNEVNRTLEGQEPIYGLPNQFVEVYRVPIPPGSQAEQMLLNQDVIITENASEAVEWATLGLTFLAQAAGLSDTVLVPLTSGGKMLGYLQASNHKSGSAVFTQDELRLLMIVSNQAAPVIENVSLMIQTRQRAQRAEGLRRIASLASSAATLDEILQYSIRELGALLHADMGAALLVDAGRSALQVHKPSFLANIFLENWEDTVLAVDDPQFPFTVTGRQHAWLSNNLLDEKAVIPFYLNIVMRWQIVSLLCVPLIMRDQGIGELWFGSSETNAFDQGEVQMISTAAGQLAGVVEQSYLRMQTDESLRRRIVQLTALTRISRELSTSLDLNNLMKLVYNEALLTTRAECGTILLFDLNRSAEYAPRVRFFTGDRPAFELSDLQKQVLETGQPAIVGDSAEIGMKTAHEQVRSILAVPVRYQGRAAGLIELHSKELNRFDQDAVDIASSLADQAAVALGNALQYEEQFNRSALLKRELDMTSKLFQVAPQLRPDQPLEEVLKAIAEAIQSITPFQAVVISLYDQATAALRRVVGVGFGEDVWEELRARTQPWKSIAQLILPEYRIGNCYFIPADKTPVVTEFIHSITLLPYDPVSDSEVEAWNPDDYLLVPLYGSQQNPLGLISLDAPGDNRRPDRPTFEALELFAAQAVLIVENRLKVVDLEKRISDLSTRESRLTQSAEAARKQVPLLLHRDLEQNLTIQSLQRQMERARSGLEIAEQSNRQADLAGMLRAVGQELASRYDLSLALIGEKAALGARLTDVVGQPPSGVNPEALFGQRNPLRQVLHDRQILLISDVAADKEWNKNSFLIAMEARSLIGLPIQLGGNRQAAVLVLGSKVLPPFTDKDDQIFGQLSRQVSVGAQNLDLLTETRRRLREVNLLLDFSRKIDVLDPNGILRLLVETSLQALPAVHAGWAALWDAREHSLVPLVAAGYPDNQSMNGIHYQETADSGPEADSPLPYQVYRQGIPRRAEVHFARDYNIPSADLLLYRHGTGGRLPVSSLLVPLKRGELGLGVLVLDNFNVSEAFSAEDEALAYSLAQQSALALESARLFVAAEQRASQLAALTQVAGAITSSLQRVQLISSLLDLLKAVLPYNTATLWLREDNLLKIVAAAGFSDEESRVGISVAVQDSILFQQIAADGQPLSVADIRLDERFPQLEEVEYYSWMGIPLLVKSELIGLIALEKREADYYTPEHIRAATTFASQAGVALENSRLFEESNRRAAELDERSQRLALLNRLSGELSGSLDVDRILEVTGRYLYEALNARQVAGIFTTEKGDCFVQAEYPPTSPRLPVSLNGVALLEMLKDSQGLYSSPDIQIQAELADFIQSYPPLEDCHGLAVVPLVTAARLLGWMVVQAQGEHRFSIGELELARTIANQSAIAIQTARLYLETRRLTEDLEKRVEERTVELRREHNNTQTLLRIITELSNSLDFDQVLQRALAILNESIGAEQSLIYLPQNRRIFKVGVALASGSDHQVGELEKAISSWVIRKKAAALVEDIETDGRWKAPEGKPVLFHSLIAVPLVFGEDALGALLLLHSQPTFFMLEQVNMVEATARQFSIALNNAELFNLIRDQAQNLGNLLRDQQIEANRSRSILEAVADGVLVTDASNRITLFNPSAQRILELAPEKILDRPLSEFSSLFGKSSQPWLETIRQWTNDPGSFQGENYAEQQELENGRVVAVTLAPVFFRDEFMATVSIFRDITHEVQVDRLKSEFVANVSHELRTPMTSIKGYVEVMLMGVTGPLSEQQEHFLKIIRNNTERLNVLVNDLLDVSRIESGRMQLEMQAVDLSDLAMDVLGEYQRRSREDQRLMNFTLKADSGLPPVKVDPSRVRQVLASLVSNGYNYTPEDGHVTIKITRNGDFVQVDVIDDGIGLSPKDQSRLFERFYRGDDPLVLASAGTGLGLAIAKILVDMHGGSIWYQSSGVRGEGSTFSFTLPRLKEEL